MPHALRTRRGVLLAAAATLAALTLAGRVLVGAGAGAAEPRPTRLEPARVERPRVVVHVTGAVRRPGVYRLREGARAGDAVRAAGGGTAAADLARLNLAAPVADGAQVLVPARLAGAPASAGSGGGGPVSLSTATVEQLDELPGIGPATAERIVEWRTQHGPFATVEDLDAVPGIGPKRLEQLRELVTP